jgi:hypothetical protein
MYRRTVQTTYRASYSNHYGKGLIRLLEVLDVRCDNSHRPVLEALHLVRRYMSWSHSGATLGRTCTFPLTGEACFVNDGA